MNQRLQQFLNAENLSQSQFADKIEVARASVSHILSGRNRPSYDFIENTIKHFPALNIEWLITGKGKMYKSTDKEQYGIIPTEFTGDLFNLTPESIDSPAVPANSAPATTSFRKVVTPRETNECEATAEAETKSQTTHEIKTSPKIAQLTEIQKEITRITVFFSDNTFKEFH